MNVLRVRLNKYVTTTTPSITSCCSNGSVKQGAVERYRLLFYLFVSLWVLPRPRSRTCHAWPAANKLSRAEGDGGGGTRNTFAAART